MGRLALGVRGVRRVLCKKSTYNLKVSLSKPEWEKGRTWNLKKSEVADSELRLPVCLRLGLGVRRIQVGTPGPFPLRAAAARLGVPGQARL
jgi:hypothetical protein